MKTYDETLTEITGVACDYENAIKITCTSVLKRCNLLQYRDDILQNVLTEIVMELLEKRDNGFWRAIENAKSSDNPTISVRNTIVAASRFRARRMPLRLGNEINVDSDDDNTIDCFCGLDDHTALNELLIQERDQHIQNAVAKLHEDQRECVVSFYFKKMSIAEIADVMQIPQGTVKRRIHTARNILKGVLNELTT